MIQRTLTAGLLSVLAGPATGATLFVAVNGSDTAGDGSAADPWATVTHAVDSAGGGDLVLVGAGTYPGRVRLRREFDVPVTVRAEPRYEARLRGDAGAALVAFEARNIIIEGFDISHAPANTGALVIQVQDLLGAVRGSDGGTDPVVSGIVFRDNIIHSSTNNDLLKVNNGVEDVLIEGNLFFDQAGSDEHIDANSVIGVVIQDNIFLNTRDAGTSSFLVVKDSNGAADTVIGARDVIVRRNVFLSWAGNDGQGFLRFGEDGTAAFEARDVLVENNLMLGNGLDLMRAPITVQGSRDVTVRHNTIVGDLPSRSYAGRLLALGANPPNEALAFRGNIYADPSGTMGAEGFNGVDLFDAPADGTVSAVLAGNLYFNGGFAIPEDAGQALTFSDDPAPIVADPLLPPLAGLTAPVWDGIAFADGSRSIRQAFLALVARYGTPGAGSPAIDAADPAAAPAEDILRQPRGSVPDLGAVETNPPTTTSEELVFMDGFEALP